jgi:hypothetical protein
MPKQPHSDTIIGSDLDKLSDAPEQVRKVCSAER